MDVTDQPPEPAPGHSTMIPIAQIDPAYDQLAESWIHATITLVWPYSSFTKSFSCLLAEPDVRLRRSNGQVKATFHGLVAERIAETHVGIGDEVVLGLGGCRLEKNDTATQTPGRYVAWDIHFDDRVHLEISRFAQHYSTVNIDPPAKSEPVQPTMEPETELPATPVPSRRQPDEETDVTQAPGAWTSPAFFQRSRVSYGGLVDSGLDPFVEEDGFVPGKGRKRPRFSMRSSEWRIVDEPASPGEKAIPVDWTEELDEDENENEDEDVKAAEDIEMSEEAPKTCDTAIEDATTISTNQPVAEIWPFIERPAEPTAAKPAEAARRVNENGELTGTLKIPIDTPRLLPVPSPGLPVPSPSLPVPSPLVSTTPDNGYFTSAAAPTSQPITTVAQSETTTVYNNEAPEGHPKTFQMETGGPILDKVESISALPGFTAEVDIPQEPEMHTTAEKTEQTPRVIQYEELESTAAPEAGSSPFPESTTPVEEPPLRDVLESYPQDVEMEDKENAAGDFEEDGDEEDFSEKDEHEEVEDEEDEDEAEDSEYDGQLSVDQTTDQEPRIQSVERPLEGTKPDEQEPHEAAPTEAESPEDYSEPEEDYDEDENMDEAGSEEYESEYEYEGRPEDIVDSEMESGEDDEEPNQVQAQSQAPVAPKNVQPDIIVLDSDDEDEQPPAPQMSQPPQSERDSEEAEGQEDEEWPSDEKEEINDGEDYEDESGDDHGQDDELVEVDDEEEVENKQSEGQVELRDDERVEEKEEEKEKEKEQVKSPDEPKWAEDKETDEEAVEEAVEEADEEADEEEGEEEGEEGGVEDEEAVEDKRTEEPVESLDYEKPEEGVAEVENETAEHDKSFDDKRNEPVELVDRTGRIDDEGVEAASNAQERSESEDDGDVFVETYEYNATHGESPASTHEAPSTEDRPQNPEEGLDRHEAPPATTDEIHIKLHRPPEPDPGLIYDGAASPGEWYDAQTDAEGSDTQDDEDGPSRQLAAEHEMQMDALAQPKSPSLLSLHDNVTEPDSHSEPETPNRHYPGLRSKHSYFAPLASLPDHFNSLTDTISVVHDASAISQSASGKRDYLLTLHVTDPSMAGTTVPAQIFRPFEEALPRVREGDAILLRDFRVAAFNHAMSLVSVDVSAWAVFTDGHRPEDQDKDTEEAQAQAQAQAQTQVHITGPPVEYGPEEHSHATDLRQWYHEDGASKIADLYLQASIDLASRNRSSSEASFEFDSDSVGLGLSPDPGQGLGLAAGPDGRRSLLRRSRRSNRRITIHELRDGRRYTEVGSPSDRESIHELRDGTVYANL